MRLVASVRNANTSVGVDHQRGDEDNPVLVLIISVVAKTPDCQSSLKVAFIHSTDLIPVRQSVDPV